MKAKKFQKKNIIIIIFLAVLNLSLILFLLRPTTSSPKVQKEQISRESPQIFKNDKLLKLYIEQYGPAATVAYLHTLESKFGSCHQPAHKTGRFAYELLGAKAFQMCGAECQSGCYHGVTEEYFKQNGTQNITENLKKLCAGGLNPFFEHQCIHGIGHGLMSWSNYDLPEALKGCDALNQRLGSCYTGVFMENIVGGLAIKSKEKALNLEAHYTKYLSDDPLYPCNAIPEKYQSSCYFYQTSRMVKLFHYDFSKVASACGSINPKYQGEWFESMGRDVGGQFPQNNVRQIQECSYVPFGLSRQQCLNGAVQNSFWDKSGQDIALDFCKQLGDPYQKNSCYKTIFDRAAQVIPRSEISAFCEKSEVGYQTQCKKLIALN